MVSPPLTGRLADAVAVARPVAGFVLPARSENRSQLILLIERVRPGTVAVLRRTDVGCAALGLDHGSRSLAVVCIRAPGRDDCS